MRDPQITIWTECHATLCPSSISGLVRVLERCVYLHREERLVRVAGVSLKEACKKLKVGTRGIDPIELACSIGGGEGGLGERME